jgi:cyclopropane-fatty-acyl-phospholipid synthase
MTNWRLLLSRIRTWLEPEGRLFVHVFSHSTIPYRFDHRATSAWIARHFFTGGTMPSHDLMHQFPDLFVVERQWRWSGKHYARTARDWLINCDRNAQAALRVLAAIHGTEAAALWLQRWRLFFLATEGLFGYGAGRDWGVSHNLLRPT